LAVVGATCGAPSPNGIGVYCLVSHYPSQSILGKGDETDIVVGSVSWNYRDITTGSSKQEADKAVTISIEVIESTLLLYNATLSIYYNQPKLNMSTDEQATAAMLEFVGSFSTLSGSPPERLEDLSDGVALVEALSEL
jgi:hypothetical protein